MRLTGCQVPELGTPSKAVLGLLTVPLGYHVSAAPLQGFALPLPRLVQNIFILCPGGCNIGTPLVILQAGHKQCKNASARSED